MALPRCCCTPLPEHQVSFTIDGREVLRWHFGAQYPRPFFFPFVGPSGVPLTRMGHPGAPNHDHHRSIWFAHHKVLGIDFWSDQTPARIRQKQWLVYEDGDHEAAMAVRLGWHDGHDPKELLVQDLVAAVRQGPREGETLLELQSSFVPSAEMFEFGQTNFGFLAVRVAKSISAHFGGGRLTNSAGQKGEKEIFGRPARWMDYSGPIALPGARRVVPPWEAAGRVGAVDPRDAAARPRPASEAAPPVEGITYFDHRDNAGQPTCWHVRDDGWMGASPCMKAPQVITRDKPLVLRYLLWAHGGGVDAAAAERVSQEFDALPAYGIVKSTVSHRQWEVKRVES